MFSFYRVDMPRTHVSKLGARSYNNYPEAVLNEAVEAVRSKKMSLRKAASSFNYKIPLGTLSYKVKEKHKAKPGRPTALTDIEEKEIARHIVAVAEWGFPFSMMDLRVFVRTYLSACGKKIPQFKTNLPSIEWANNFLVRQSDILTCRVAQNIKRSRASVTKEAFVSYFKHLEKTLIDENGEPVPPERIFNYDETNLSDDPGTKKCIFQKGVKYPERIKDFSKSAISIMFCGSAVGKMIPAYVVYKSTQLWSTWQEGGPDKTRYGHSKSGWFDAASFADWFEYTFVPHVRDLPGRKVLIGDNLSTHFSERVLKLAKERNISLTCLVPNSTHLSQPLDVAFYGPLKKYWRGILDAWKGQGGKRSCLLTKEAFPKLLKKLYEKLYPDEPEVSSNLVAGFRKCGIFPLCPDQVVSRLPDVSQAAGDVSANVSTSVIDVLRSMREGEPSKPGRRRKVNVPPGGSISVENLLGPPRPKRACVGEGPTSKPSSIDEKDLCDDDSDDDLPGAFLSSSEDDEFPCCSTPVPAADVNFSCIEESDFIVVKYALKRSTVHYVGKVSAVDEGDFEVLFMKRAKGDIFVFPDDKAETDIVDRGSVVAKLPKPQSLRRGRFSFACDLSMYGRLA